MKGRVGDYTLDIPLTESIVAPSMLDVVTEITVAGRVFVDTFPPVKSLSTMFTWDGLDAYGRERQGAQLVVAKIKYVFPYFYFLLYETLPGYKRIHRRRRVFYHPARKEGRAVGRSPLPAPCSLLPAPQQ